MIICDGQIMTVKDLYHAVLGSAFNDPDSRKYFLRAVRVALLQRGHSLASWARKMGILKGTLHNALTGRRNSPMDRRIIKTVKLELGL